MQHQLALGLGFVLAVENFQLAGQLVEDLPAVDAVKLCLLRIVGNHITAPAGAFFKQSSILSLCHRAFSG